MYEARLCVKVGGGLELSHLVVNAVYPVRSLVRS